MVFQLLTISLMATTAKTGTSNITTIRMDSTARNWLYLGKKPKNKSDAKRNCRPNDNSTSNKVPPASHHLTRPLTKTKPRIKKNTTIAPKYQGPEVNALSPQ